MVMEFIVFFFLNIRRGSMVLRFFLFTFTFLSFLSCSENIVYEDTEDFDFKLTKINDLSIDEGNTINLDINNEDTLSDYDNKSRAITYQCQYSIPSGPEPNNECSDIGIFFNQDTAEFSFKPSFSFNEVNGSSLAILISGTNGNISGSEYFNITVNDTESFRTTNSIRAIPYEFSSYNSLMPGDVHDLWAPDDNDYDEVYTLQNLGLARFSEVSPNSYDAPFYTGVTNGLSSNQVFEFFIDPNNPSHQVAMTGRSPTLSRAVNFSIDGGLNFTPNYWGLYTGIVTTIGYAHDLGAWSRILVGSESGLYLTDDRGLSFSSIAHFTGQTIYDIAYDNVTDTLLVGTDAGLSVSLNYSTGGAFTDYSTFDGVVASGPVTAVAIKDDQTWALTFRHASGHDFSYTLNGGATFANIDSSLNTVNLGEIVSGSSNKISFAPNCNGGDTLFIRYRGGVRYTSDITNIAANNFVDTSMSNFDISSSGTSDRIFLSNEGPNDILLNFSDDCGSSSTQIKQFGTNSYRNDRLNDIVIHSSSENIFLATHSHFEISTDFGLTFSNRLFSTMQVSRETPDGDVHIYGIALYTSPGGDGTITNTGINNINGINTRNFTEMDFFGDNEYFLMSDSNGFLYSTDAGANYTTYNTVNYPTLAGNDSRDIYIDGDGAIWIVSDHGAGISVSDDKANFTVYNTGNSNLGNNTVNQVDGRADRSLVAIVHSDGVTLADFSNILSPTFNHLDNTYPGIEYRNEITSVLYREESGELYLGGDTGIVMYSSDGGVTFTNFTISDGLDAVAINRIRDDKYGNIYFMTNGGGLFIKYANE